ncbi:MAG: hypothetical protein N3G74_01535 [Candidatus Micrarchaeota archaeon]|nr:hypothetical protein [Candidatus Micrarchaeota archaeon]
MIKEIAYTMFFGKPLIFYVGLLGFLFFLATLSIGILISKGKSIDIKWHKTSAIITFIFVLLHAIMGLFLYF